jgi:hypothetical protein
VSDTDTAMKALVIEAMYKSLDADKREALIRSAIATLLSPSTKGHGYYGSQTTLLQDAFNDAIQQVARELVFEEVRKEGPIRERIRALCGEAMGRLVLADDGALATELSTALVRALRDSRA